MVSGKKVVGSFINFYAPSLVELIGYSGLDFIVIDDEHGAYTYPQIEEMVRIAEMTGITPIVRVNYDQAAIQKALDRGALGVQVPMVNNKAEAEAVVRKAKFQPAGTRGAAYSVRAAHFGEYKGKAYLDAADANTLVIVHIETTEAVEHFEEIISVPGIDMAFVGPTDLSVSMGYKAEGAGHPEVRKVVKELLHKGRQKGILMGSFANDADDMKRCADLGANYILMNASGLIFAKYKEIVKAAQSLT